jgi:hypothetical protein
MQDPTVEDEAILSVIALQCAFDAWRSLARASRDRWRSQVLGVGLRRFFALRRAVAVWHAKGVAAAAATAQRVAATSHFRRTALRSSIWRWRRFAEARRSDADAVRRLCTAAALRRWRRTAATARRLSSLAAVLSVTTTQHACATTLVAWAHATASRRALRLALERMVEVAERSAVRRAWDAWHARVDRATKNQMLLRLRSTWGTSHRAALRALRVWAAFAELRGRQRAGVVSLAGDRRRRQLRASFLALEAHAAGRRLQREHLYLAVAHHDSVALRRAFYAFRAGVAVAVASAPVLETCAAVLAGWRRYVLQRRGKRRLAALAHTHHARVLRGRYMAGWVSWWRLQLRKQAARAAASECRRQLLLAGTFTYWARVVAWNRAWRHRLETARMVRMQRMLREAWAGWRAFHARKSLTTLARSLAQRALVRTALLGWRAAAAAGASGRRVRRVGQRACLRVRAAAALHAWAAAAQARRFAAARLGAAEQQRRRTLLARTITCWAAGAAYARASRARAWRAYVHWRSKRLRAAITAWRAHAGGSCQLQLATSVVAAAHQRRRVVAALSVWRHTTAQRVAARRAQDARVTSAARVLQLASLARLWAAWTATHRVRMATAVRRAHAAWFYRSHLLRRAVTAWQRYCHLRAVKLRRIAAARRFDSVRCMWWGWGMWRRAHAGFHEECAALQAALRFRARQLQRRTWRTWCAYRADQARLAAAWLQAEPWRHQLGTGGASSAAGTRVRVLSASSTPGPAADGDAAAAASESGFSSNLLDGLLHLVTSAEGMVHVAATTTRASLVLQNGEGRVMPAARAPTGPAFVTRRRQHTTRESAPMEEARAGAGHAAPRTVPLLTIRPGRPQPRALLADTILPSAAEPKLTHEHEPRASAPFLARAPPPFVEAEAASSVAAPTSANSALAAASPAVPAVRSQALLAYWGNRQLRAVHAEGELAATRARLFVVNSLLRDRLDGADTDTDNAGADVEAKATGKEGAADNDEAAEDQGWGVAAQFDASPATSMLADLLEAARALAGYERQLVDELTEWELIFSAAAPQLSALRAQAGKAAGMPCAAVHLAV